MPQNGEHPPTGRILVIMAHPDDIEFGAAGSIARWVDEGAEVTYCIITDGA
ncbi:MAG TPA: PIG-L family deacetylase, partial [Chloroflexi bacterium]|nr:PIG-L family deacetylase [Chloroflexota bacterium]